MKKLTLVIDDFENKELKEYLLSLRGIESVQINFKECLEIIVCYDEKLINEKVIYLEVLTFLDILKIPSLVSFDKHSRDDTNIYKVESDMCCEYCFKMAVDELFEIDGIKRIDTNYFKQYLGEYKKRGKDTFIIYYDPKVITENRMKEIIKEIDI